MTLINETEAWEYFLGLENDCARSAVIALKIALLDFASPLGSQTLVSQIPLDVLMLYRSAVYAFAEDGGAGEDLPPYDHSIGRQEAVGVLSALRDEEISLRASRFLAEAVRLSKASSAELDLLFLVDLFVRCVQRCGVSVIVDGTISRESQRLKDPDNW